MALRKIKGMDSVFSDSTSIEYNFH
jgi:hypothetical protein